MTASQLEILSNCQDGVEGLSAALTSELEGRKRTSPEREVFANMAQGIAASMAGLFIAVEKQSLEHAGGPQAGKGGAA